MRHVITRDASPYSAFVLENFRFSAKARYVNDVHLPRFDRLLHSTFCNRRSDLVLQLLHGFTNQFYTEQPPVVRCTTGIQRISPPRTLGMIAKRRFCVNCRARPKLARGVRHPAPILLTKIRLTPSQVREHLHVAFL